MSDRSLRWRGGAAGLCVLLVLLTLTACQWRRITVNDPIKPEDVTFIERGKTPLADVVARLGAPDEIVSTGHLLTARYRFRDGKYFKIDAGRLLLFVSPVTPEMSMARSQVEMDVFQVIMDMQGIVQEYAFAFRSPAGRFNPWPF